MPTRGNGCACRTRGPPPTLKAASSPAQQLVTPAAPDALSPAHGQGRCTPGGCGPLTARVRKTGLHHPEGGQGSSGRVRKPWSPVGHPILQAETGSHTPSLGEKSLASLSEAAWGGRFSSNIFTWNIRQREVLCPPSTVFLLNCRDLENPKITPLR